MKFLRGILICLIVFTLVGINSYAKATNDIEGENELVFDRYLIESGYPKDIVDLMDLDTKKEYYEGKYKFESINRTSGVFTENNKLEYKVDQGGKPILTESNNLKLQNLLSNKDEVNKILDENGSTELIKRLDKQSTLAALKNWESNLICSQISYKDRVSKKKLLYLWKWKYAPVWTLTDKVAIAWSGGFTANQNAIRWSYNAGLTETTGYNNFVKSYKGTTYSDYTPSSGVGVDIDIKKFPGYRVRYHSGSLSATIRKRTSFRQSYAAVGTYYHARVRSGLALGFSAGKDTVSIGITWQGVSTYYDKAKDTGCQFWSMPKK